MQEEIRKLKMALATTVAVLIVVLVTLLTATLLPVLSEPPSSPDRMTIHIKNETLLGPQEMLVDVYVGGRDITYAYVDTFLVSREENKTFNLTNVNPMEIDTLSIFWHQNGYQGELHGVTFTYLPEGKEPLIILLPDGDCQILYL